MGCRFVRLCEWRCAVAPLAIVAASLAPPVHGQIGVAPGVVPENGAPLGQPRRIYGSTDPPDSHYVVPAAATAQDLVAFIEKVRLFASENGDGTLGAAQLHRHMRRSSASMTRGVDALLKLDPTEEQRLAALESSLVHLKYVQAFVPNGHDEMLITGIYRLTKDASEPVREKVASLALDFEILNYSTKTAEEREALADRLIKAANESEFTHIGVHRLTRFCEAAEAAGELQLAKRAIDKLRPKVGRLEGIDVDRKPVVVGLYRRLALPGKTMEIDGWIRDMQDGGRMGDKINWNSYRGKVVVLYFFDESVGSEVRALAALQDQFRDRGVEVVGFFIGLNGAFSLPIFTQHTYNFPIIITHELGKDGIYQPTCVRYGLTRAPRTMIIGKDGKVVNANASVKSLEHELETLLN